jgi:alkylation response protein AidB-like acyl-CoA dehydrogenase
MHTYRPDTSAIAFLLDTLGASEVLGALPVFAEVDRALMLQVIDEQARFAAEVIAPLDATADSPGSRFDDGRVITPPGFVDAYRAFVEAGWPLLACDPQDGGQGLPWLLEGVLYEMLAGASHGWTMAPGLLHGAYECIRHHGDEAIKSRFLSHIASGEWLATMCLTEPQAGSDLGLVRTQATPHADGSFRVRGTKIFISGGEHDLTANIVHLVLAREPGAPAGPRGLSLYVAPKLQPDASRNAIACERIEDKMGLHGSPTCVMRFDDAVAWRIGEAGRGLQAMFVMMNAARLHVALQGLGLLDKALQKAEAYAQERLQMRAPGALRGSGEADPIVRHPAIARILGTERAWIAGLRLLAYRTGVELDVARHHPDGVRRARAEAWCRFTTPVLKALCTEQAFLGASRCLQVFGGHGYVKEWGIEQVVRDSRITMIYEGTNEIQAIDLVTRVLLADSGASQKALFQALLAEHDDADSRARFDLLCATVEELRSASRTRAELPCEVADDMLRAVGLALFGWSCARIDQAAKDAVGPCLDIGASAQRWILPEYDMRIGMVRRAIRP